MPMIFLKYRHIVFISLIFSMFIHLLILKTTIFIFPITNERPKPHLEFLGPILKNHNMLSPSSANNSESSSQETIKNFVKNEKIPLLHQTVEKPIKLPSGAPIAKKTTPKLIFPVLLKEEEMKIEEDLKKSGIDVDLPPYNPLKMQRHDKN